MEWLFGGDVAQDPLATYQVAARAVFVYVAGLALVRLGKSRLVGRVAALDILVGFILGSLLSRGITGHASLSGTLAASAALIAAHWLFTALAQRWHVFGFLMKGSSIPLIQNGTVMYDNLRHSHISERDLGEALRLHGVMGPDAVAMAYKERNGDISVIPRGNDVKPT